MKRKDNKYILRGIVGGVLAILAFTFSMSANSQDPVDAEGYVTDSEKTTPLYTLTGTEKELIASRIAGWNTPWKKVELDGKIIIDGLPVKPSVKIFMENNKKIFISVRVVFLGEVARVEITPEEIILINKMKQTYFKGDPGSILEEDPTIISELQALLLGRLALVGSGEFQVDQITKIDIVQQTADEFLVIPNYFSTGAINFGYSVSTVGQLQELVAVYAGFDGYVNLSYARSGERLQIEGEIEGGKRPMGATLQFDAPNWDAKGFSRMKVPSEYRQVGFKEVLRLN